MGDKADDNNLPGSVALPGSGADPSGSAVSQIDGSSAVTVAPSETPKRATRRTKGSADPIQPGQGDPAGPTVQAQTLVDAAQEPGGTVGGAPGAEEATASAAAVTAEHSGGANSATAEVVAPDHASEAATRERDPAEAAVDRVSPFSRPRGPRVARRERKRDAIARLRALGAELTGLRFEVDFQFVTPTVTGLYRSTWADMVDQTGYLTASAFSRLGSKRGEAFLASALIEAFDAIDEMIATEAAPLVADYNKAAQGRKGARVKDSSTPTMRAKIILTSMATKRYLSVLQAMDDALAKATGLYILDMRDVTDVQNLDERFRKAVYGLVRGVREAVTSLRTGDVAPNAAAVTEQVGNPASEPPFTGANGTDNQDGSLAVGLDRGTASNHDTGGQQLLAA